MNQYRWSPPLCSLGRSVVFGRVSISLIASSLNPSFTCFYSAEHVFYSDVVNSRTLLNLGL